MTRYFLGFLALFLSFSAYAGWGCMTFGGVTNCYMDAGVSSLKTAVVGLIGLSSIGVAVYLIYKVMNK